MISASPQRRPELTVSFARFRSTVDMFRSRLQTDAARTAARRKLDGRWVDVTWSQLAADGEELAWGLLALGIEPRAMVALLGSTRLEWTLCDLAVMHAGAISVPIYQTNTAEEVHYVLADAGAALIFAENASQLKKLQQIKYRLPRVHRVVLMEGEGAASDGWVLSLEQLKKLGAEQRAKTPAALAARLESQRRDDLHTVLYTSGTTGQPKGVMITNDSMIFAAEAIMSSGLITREMKHLLFLPFAHSFAQIIKCAWLASGFTQIFAESVDKLVANAGETAPTALSGVPRVYEKVFNAMVSGGSAQPGLQGALFRMAMGEFEAWAKAQAKGQRYSSFGWVLAKKLVFPKLRAKVLGLLGGQMQEMLSGGAPLAPKIARFFDLLGFDLLEGYGLTETLALTSVNLPGQNRLGTVGRPYPGIEVRLAADGEVLQRGRHIMRGYLNQPQATSEVIDKDGWFSTGDVAEIDREGYIRITDRKKDLIKTSGGKYIAPQLIEGTLKMLSQLISQVVVIGEGHKYVAVLVTVAEAEATKVAVAAGHLARTYAEATQSPAVRAQVGEAIERLNAGVASYETIKRFAILDHDFTQETGQLTPTLKVKRKLCTEKYKAEIEGLYRGE